MRLATLSLLAFSCVATVAFGQEKPVPSAEVDQALHERVSQYMQFMVDRAFSKAYPLVADESKDWYLGSGKATYKSFKIQSVEYSQDLQAATVKTLIAEVFSMQGHDISKEVVVTDLWKLEDGKWMYFHDPDVYSTPMGDIRIDRKAPSHSADVPKDLSQDAATKAEQRLTLEATTDKSEMVFVQGAAGSDEIIVRNGFAGPVDLISDIVGDYGAFSVEPRNIEIQSGKQVVLKVSYKPLDRVIETFLRVRVEPFDRMLNVTLRLKPAVAASSSSASQ
jgi:hypothetical protein